MGTAIINANKIEIKHFSLGVWLVRLRLCQGLIFSYFLVEQNRK